MKKFYVIATGIAVMVPLIYFLRLDAKESHQKELRACTEKLEKIRVDASKIPSVDLYPFQVHRQTYDWVSTFEGGLTAFSKTQNGREMKGFVDFNNNIILEYHDPVKVDGVAGFGGFENGRTQIFVWEQDSVPWGFLLPYGNPVPRVDGTIDCTGKVTLNRTRIPMPTFL